MREPAAVRRTAAILALAVAMGCGSQHGDSDDDSDGTAARGGSPATSTGGSSTGGTLGAGGHSGNGLGDASGAGATATGESSGGTSAKGGDGDGVGGTATGGSSGSASGEAGLGGAAGATSCGDGVVETPAEECDDANDVSDDGCSLECAVEAEWDCTASSPSVCIPRSSCAGMTGTECQGGDCCESLPVPGGTFGMREPDALQASVSDFYLDRFEVTVGRFRRFLAAYEAWRAAGNPKAGAGANAHIADSGWDTAWSASLPASAATYRSTSGLLCNSLYPTWTDASVHDTLPINCVSWYTAFAFCAWDGGRLPTETEYEYAEAGGAEDRTYPWGETPVPDNVDGTYATYNCLGDGTGGCTFADILPVGSKPLGVAAFGQHDMGGSMREWVLDWSWGSSSVGPTTTNFANLVPGTERVVRSSGWEYGGIYLKSVNRDAFGPINRYYSLGIRCARDP
jgi:sulfatase modifying factor 1